MGAIKIDAPKAPRRVECGEAVSPFALGRGLGRWLCPLPRKILHFFASKSNVCDAL